MFSLKIINFYRINIQSQFIIYKYILVFEAFKQYHQAAKSNYNGAGEQVAIDTLNMALMDRTQGRGGLVAFLLKPRDKD